MSNTLKLKRSNTANALPTAGQLDYGELAINYLDGNLFYKNDSNQVVVLASNQFLSVSGNVTGGNLNTAGQVSATGNLVSGNVSTAGNVTAGNVSTVGNVTANYFIGDGSLLSNISGNITTTSITNGTSNVVIPTSGGNVYVAVNGVSNTAQFSQGSLFVQGPIATPKTVSIQAIVANNVNSIMISPVTIEPTGNIYVPSNSTLTIFTPT